MEYDSHRCTSCLLRAYLGIECVFREETLLPRPFDMGYLDVMRRECVGALFPIESLEFAINILVEMRPPTVH